MGGTHFLTNTAPAFRRRWRPAAGSAAPAPHLASTWHGCCARSALSASPSIGSSLPSAASYSSELYASPWLGSSLGDGAPRAATAATPRRHDGAAARVSALRP